jgi:hypothetical protein
MESTPTVRAMSAFLTVSSNPSTTPLFSMPAKHWAVRDATEYKTVDNCILQTASIHFRCGTELRQFSLVRSSAKAGSAISRNRS